MKPAFSKTRRCLEIAGWVILKGAANSITVVSPTASRARMARRVGSLRAANLASRFICGLFEPRVLPSTNGVQHQRRPAPTGVLHPQAVDVLLRVHPEELVYIQRMRLAIVTGRTAGLCLPGTAASRTPLALRTAPARTGGVQVPAAWRWPQPRLQARCCGPIVCQARRSRILAAAELRSCQRGNVSSRGI